MARQRVKDAHLVDGSSEANKVRLFIRNVQPTYKHPLRFMPFRNFIALRNVGLAIEEELSRETPTKTSSI